MNNLLIYKTILLIAFFVINCHSEQTRVQIARSEKAPYLKKLLLTKGITYSQCKVYLRVFKREEKLEVWAKNNSDSIFTLIKEYEFCTNSGTLGPKRKEGDLQIPEGIYHINRFNPRSLFYLSLGLNYPNDSDLYFADKTQPGSDIFIHGDCVSVGCIAITDDKIKELYTLTQQASTNGQRDIRVDIFPFKFKDNLKNTLAQNPDYQRHQTFWENLEQVYSDFEQTHQLRTVAVDKHGKYYIIKVIDKPQT